MGSSLGSGKGLGVGSSFDSSKGLEVAFLFCKGEV